MAVDLNEFLQIIQEQSKNDNKPPTQTNTMQRERLELQRERLELQRERLELEKQKHNARSTPTPQNKNDLIIYIFSILLTFASMLASVIVFIIILIKG
ncbi:MAG: hypothetical protein IKI95_02650 [Clostridia bacterium]|nr:hypothetical protein [Clostridia bacterium]